MNPFLAGEQILAESVLRYGATIELIDPESGTATPLRANIGATQSREQGSGGRALPMTVTRTVDFIVRTVDLPGVVSAAHRIACNGSMYKPTSISGEPPVRESGRHGLLTRIHTIRIG